MNLTYTLGANGHYLLDVNGEPVYIEVHNGAFYRLDPKTLQRERAMTRDELKDEQVFSANRITGRGPAK